MRRTYFVTTIVLAFAAHAVIATSQEKAKKTNKVDMWRMLRTVTQLSEPSQIELVEVPLSNALNALAKDFKLRLEFNAKDLPDKVVSLSVENKPVGNILQELLDQAGWTFVVKPEGTLVLHPAQK